MQMDHNELAKRIESRLDKIENKLDKHLEIYAENTADIRWIKGYIKISITALIAISGTIITIVLK